LKPILWRLTAASAGVLVALSMNVGPATASESRGPIRPEHGPVQVADQSARTYQDADSHATSKQFLPINANVPVQILSLGSNGGSTTQSNNSTAWSNASNQAWTDQSLHQSQSAPVPEHRKGHDDRKPEGHGPKCDRSKDHGRKDEGQKDDGWKPEGHGPEDHGPKGPAPAFQRASQQASTDQNANSSAKSEQIAPVNANVPIQILSLGHNGGDTTQSNNSTAASSATNQAGTSQVLGQAQGVGGLLG